jgi:hypothetical protein
MAEAKPNAEQVVDLRDDDVQAARRLLSTERSALRAPFFLSCNRSHDLSILRGC